MPPGVPQEKNLMPPRIVMLPVMIGPHPKAVP